MRLLELSMLRLFPSPGLPSSSRTRVAAESFGVRCTPLGTLGSGDLDAGDRLSESLCPWSDPQTSISTSQVPTSQGPERPGLGWCMSGWGWLVVQKRQ